MSHCRIGRPQLGKSVAGAALSVVLATGLAPAAAFAYDNSGYAPDEEASLYYTDEDTGVQTKYLTGAATRAAMPITEILGISGVEETGNFVSMSDPLYSNLAHPSSKYFLMGTDVNQNPNPYMWNTNYAAYSGATVASADKVSENTDGRQGGGQGPDAALDYIGRTASITSLSALDPTDLAVWNMQPDIVVGDNSGNASYTATASAVASGYSPSQETYSFRTNASLVDEMYRVAADADAIVANGNRVLRYDSSASEIALQYEKFIKGVQGYVLQQVGSNKKTVAVVLDYDNATHTYSIAQTGIQSGTASTNRALEAVEVVANNLAPASYSAVTVSELSSCDAIIVSGQNVGSASGMTQAQIAAQILSDTNKTAYTANSSLGAMYGVTMNSVENAQNISRIIGFVYPGVIDQIDLTAYYYETFYHINSGDLEDVMALELGNVDSSDVADDDSDVAFTLASNRSDYLPSSAYDAATIESDIIDAGCSYIINNYSSLSTAERTALTPDNYTVNGTLSFAQPY